MGRDVLGKGEMGEKFSTAPLEAQLGPEGVLGSPDDALCSVPVPPGLHRVTLKNMWFGYSSLQRCLSSSGSSAVSWDSDGGQK